MSINSSVNKKLISGLFVWWFIYSYLCDEKNSASYTSARTLCFTDLKF